MKNMHLEGWISVGLAAIALVTAGVAGWQATQARRQAKAAEDQAKAAKDQAKAAEDQVQEARRSAVAAEQQVGLMRHQHETDQAEQAALVAVEVDYFTERYGDDNHIWTVKITNHSNQPVHRPQVESMGEAPVRWGWGPVYGVDEIGEEFTYKTDEMLLPHKSTDVPYQYVDSSGRVLNRFDRLSDNTKFVVVDDMTITFSMSGVRWQRTGNRPPVCVVDKSVD